MFGGDGDGNLTFQLSLGSAVGIGCFSVEKLVYQNSKCPDICFGSVDVMNQAFRRHIDGRSDVNILKIIP